ncbi:hypothetical protein BDR05DRAFT_953197 [Suillus weaverae]|nr:hypothetical protein BDR05DRAFT_953197 [Suillus weaverae]
MASRRVTAASRSSKPKTAVPSSHELVEKPGDERTTFKVKRKQKAKDKSPEQQKISAVIDINASLQTLSSVAQSGWKANPEEGKTKSSTVSKVSTAVSRANEALSCLRVLCPNDLDVERAASSMMSKLLVLEMHDTALPFLGDMHARLLALLGVPDSKASAHSAPTSKSPIRLLSLPLPTIPPPADTVLLTLISTTLLTWVPYCVSLPRKHTDTTLTRVYTADKIMFLNVCELTLDLPYPYVCTQVPSMHEPWNRSTKRILGSNPEVVHSNETNIRRSLVHDKVAANDHRIQCKSRRTFGSQRTRSLLNPLKKILLGRSYMPPTLCRKGADDDDALTDEAMLRKRIQERGWDSIDKYSILWNVWHSFVHLAARENRKVAKVTRENQLQNLGPLLGRVLRSADHETLIVKASFITEEARDLVKISKSHLTYRPPLLKIPTSLSLLYITNELQAPPPPRQALSFIKSYFAIFDQDIELHLQSSWFLGPRESVIDVANAKGRGSSCSGCNLSFTAHAAVPLIPGCHWGNGSHPDDKVTALNLLKRISIRLIRMVRISDSDTISGCFAYQGDLCEDLSEAFRRGSGSVLPATYTHVLYWGTTSKFSGSYGDDDSELSDLPESIHASPSPPRASRRLRHALFSFCYAPSRKLRTVKFQFVSYFNFSLLRFLVHTHWTAMQPGNL